MVILNPYYRDSLAFYYEKKDSYHFHVRNRNLKNNNISQNNKLITLGIIALFCIPVGIGIIVWYSYYWMIRPILKKYGR